MRRVFIAGSGIVSGLAETLEENWQALLDGKSAVKAADYFDTSAIEFKNTAALPGLREIKDKNLVQELARKAVEQINTIPKETFVVWTGIKGNVPFIEAGMKNTDLHLASDYSGWLQKEFGLSCGKMEVNAACASSTVGIALATQKIGSGQQKSALVCAADLASRFVHMGFSALKALTASTARPFDVNRDGLILGDGACAILLADEETCNKYNLTKFIEISGWGISNDSNHITGPARDGSGLIAAIEQSLQMTKTSAQDIQAFCVHGTATVYNDGMELTAVETLFGGRRFPIFSVKGATGHTLGAAGGIETALSALALKNKEIPPTVGLIEPEERAVGRVMNSSQKFDGDNILTSNSGFGGVNAALLLKRVEEE